MSKKKSKKTEIDASATKVDKPKNEKDEIIQKKDLQKIDSSLNKANNLIYWGLGILAAAVLIFLISFFFFRGPTAKLGDTVGVWYSGKLDTGEIFDTNIKEVVEKNNLPAKTSYQELKFKLGAGGVIPGFEKGIMGMRVGQKKTLRIPPEEAYGSYVAELVKTISAEEFAKQFNVSLTKDLQGRQIIGEMNGKKKIGIITEVGKDYAKIDFNGRLAGKTLVFEVELASLSSG